VKQFGEMSLHAANEKRHSLVATNGTGGSEGINEYQGGGLRDATLTDDAGERDVERFSSPRNYRGRLHF